MGDARGWYMEAFEPLHADDPRQVGPFRIVARLGAGGMGQVYLGRSKAGRAVAVKVVRPDLAGDSEFRRRFAREVAVARTVSGFFTAGVVAADPDGSPPWLATAYVPGLSLDRAVSEFGPWPEASVLALGAGLAEALEATHGAGVVHRDLKPSNVLLAPDGPRVIDFGISVALEASRLTRTDMVVGTPGFMSPEQLTGDPVGPPSDVFSLGAVLAFTATGTGPFGTGAPPAMLYRVVHQEPDLSMLPPTLRSVVARCLAKRPEQRPSAPELLDELTGSITAKPTIVEFFAESAWMPDKVARAVHACAAAPQPAPPGTPPAPPRPLPVGTADDPASQQPEAAGTPLQPEGPVAPSTPARADGGAQRSTVPSSEIYRDPPRRHDGGEPARKADALGGTAGRPAGLNRRTALLAFGAIGVSVATTAIIAGRFVEDDPDDPVEGRSGRAGELKWSFTTYGEVSSPVVSRGIVYIGSEKLYAVDVVSGRERWSFRTGGPVLPPAVDNRSVYACSRDEELGDDKFRVLAINAATGKRRWSVRLAPYVSPPVVGEGMVFVSYGTRRVERVRALDADTGRELWSFTPGGPIGAPAFGDGAVYIRDARNRLYAIDTKTGRERWSFDPATGPTNADLTAPAVTRESVYYGDDEGRLYAIDTATGRLRWAFNTDQRVSAPPGIGDGAVYAALEYQVYAIDSDDGRVRWSFTTDGRIGSSPTAADGVVYVGTEDNTLYALDAATGRQRWSFDASDRINGSPAVADGVVFVGTADETLYAFYAI